MDDIIKLTKSDVSFLNYPSNGKILTKSATFSEDGYLVIHHGNSIFIGTISFKSDSQNRKYFLNQEKVEIQFNMKYLLRLKECNFKNTIHETKEPDDKIYQLILSDNYTFNLNNDIHDFIRVDWGPFNTAVYKSYLALMNFDGRIIIIVQNRRKNKWEKEFDMLELYHEFYKGNLLTSSCNEEGLITCKDINEYMQVKKDLKLISFSWSSIMRQSDHNQYCLIALLSDSGIVTVWRIVNEQFESRCEIIRFFRLDKYCGIPKTIQFCDISNDLFIISVFYSNEKIVAYPHLINCGDDDKISVESLANVFTINDQLKYSQVSKVCWSMKNRTLIVGYESHILFAKIDLANESDLSASVYWLELPSDDEISGIVVKESMVYVTAHDGLFAIKIDQNPENIEFSEIIFECPELNGNVDFKSAFVSSNAVHLGFVKIDNDKLLKEGEEELVVSEIVLIKLMPEKEMFNILMDDSKPFNRKQDAVEELRNIYFNNKFMLNVAFQKLAKFDIDHEGNSLHNLQLARYICILFGYHMNMDMRNYQYDIFKIRKLEAMIISRNISKWLEGFCDLSVSNTNKDDCFFVLSVSVKLKLLPHKKEIVNTIEAAQSRSRSLLRTEFGVASTDIEKFEFLNKTDYCPTCRDSLKFNLVSGSCLKNHITPRCCKSLKLCYDTFKTCRICGAADLSIDNTKDMSNWRLGIANSNCPLCDCKFP